MGYQKIPNLDKDLTIIDIFKWVYATEKIHGTSAHIKFKSDEPDLSFFSGGVKYANFVKLFDVEKLRAAIEELGCFEVDIYGEAYGGKCQGMSNIYGKDLKFAVFEVKIGEHWLNVEKAAKVVSQVGLEFVHWIKGPATEEFVNRWRDADSEQAIRNGMGPGHSREGVVIRPPVELTLNSGKRMVAKHKVPEARETKSVRPLDPTKHKKLSEAKAVAEEYVISMRLTHVLDKFVAKKNTKVSIIDDEFRPSIENIRDIINLMVEDIKVEEGDLIEWNKEVEQAIKGRTARLYKDYIFKGLL